VKLQEKESYQLIEPYLNNFFRLNPRSVVICERKPDNLIDSVFICPGITNSKLRHVRPVMSMDGAHLQSEWKGTLYIATLMTGLNKIIPIAYCIMAENKNDERWLFFKHLKEVCPTLHMQNVIPRCGAYKYFTFVWDRG
jgi:hypothetical protein